MDTKRLILYAALGLILYSLWNAWKVEHTPVLTSSSQQQEKVESTLLPTLPQNNSSDLSTNNTVTTTPTLLPAASPITINTDVFSLNIDMQQGDIVGAKLLKFPVRVEDPHNPIALLYDNSQQNYVAKSNLVVRKADDTEIMNVIYTSSKNNYVLENGQNNLIVTLNGETNTGLKIKKEFTFTRGSYLISVRYSIQNTASTSWQGYLNTQLTQHNPQEDSSSIFHVGSYIGASYSLPGKHRYQKISFKQMNKANLNEEAAGGWIAMQQHYFLSAWIPQRESNNVLYSRAANDTYTIGAVSNPILLDTNQSQTLNAQLYLGPEDTAILKKIAPGLELTVDYGWLWFLSSALFSLMKMIYSVVGNWGWSIVLVTMVIKLLFYRLSARSYKSMAGMRKLQPKLQALRERYGDDKAKISQATMELYRQEKVNPLGGCLPILVQIPVFIALYWVLLESVELRQAPFIFWINDLAVPDPFHVLPILMGITMLIQQRLNPAPPDPMQAKLMMFLPVLFTAIFWNFPAGLVLYWIVNNTLSILQQWYITKHYGEDLSPKNHLITAK